MERIVFMFPGRRAQSLCRWGGGYRQCATRRPNSYCFFRRADRAQLAFPKGDLKANPPGAGNFVSRPNSYYFFRQADRAQWGAPVPLLQLATKPLQCWYLGTPNFRVPEYFAIFWGIPAPFSHGTSSSLDYEGFRKYFVVFVKKAHTRVANTSRKIVIFSSR